MGGRKTLTLAQHRARNGYLFISPWIIGLVAFFIVPIFKSIQFSFSNITTENTGFVLSAAGFSNYIYALTVDAEYPQKLYGSVVMILTQVPVIITFSFFVALLLKQKFRGSYIVKTVFFLPVIMSSGLFVQLQSSFGQLTAGALDVTMQNAPATIQILKSINLERYLYEMGVSSNLVQLVTGPINSLYNVITNSGIQIFIFLAGLNSIPSSLYEACYIEGAKGWEAFWKITFPMMVPMVLVCVIYSIIDSFTAVTNPVMDYIYIQSFQKQNFALGCAMSWIYFVILAVIMSFVSWFIGKRTFYYT